MKKDMLNSLKHSLEQERKASKNKTEKSIEDRFLAADNLFNDSSEFQKSTALETKINVIRDTFTLPESDYNLINVCKTKLLENKISATKSEIIRAGLILLNKLTDEELVSSYKLVNKIKIGRPKNI
ncbi:hypothetical protein Trichorick_01575 (plasmid) [Candidatus Trichorickettsia mobilis]|uniref:hypothetical protein n=1 Tax=Candidatus Trichorickettsia mobilis TaxID=1346319 RepID=UPI002B25B180|nr:hypothetical protein [Candidatus Trichorickettsia mobilis]WPY01657.1 hypothetical protein Trichorick_01575 [Candidatus Trichorickettsia mobilis]